MIKLFIVLLVCFVPNFVEAETVKRVVSVGGSSTEIIYALGAEELLVGSDTTSYYPDAAEKLPKVGYQRALSAEGILSLSPDLLILNEEAGPPAVIEQLQFMKLSMLTVSAGRSVEDVSNQIESIGTALGRIDEAAGLRQKMNNEYSLLKSMNAKVSHKKTVLFILSHGGGSPMVAGVDTAADAIITLSGAQNAVTNYKGYKPLTPEAAVSMQPDYILVTEQGVEGLGGIEQIKGLPGLALTEAARHNRIVSMDSLRMLGFGPRTVDAAIELHRKFYVQ